MKREKQDDNVDKPATCFLRRCPRRLSTHMPEKAWVRKRTGHPDSQHPTGSQIIRI